MSNEIQNSSNVKSNKYKLVPPDGGWGYIIWIAAMINFSATSMFSGCFGMVFNNFMTEIGMNSTSLTLLNGVNAMCIAIAGFMAGLLMKVMSMRQLALLAGILFNAGVFCTVFVNSQVPFFICYGVLQSSGLGILYNLTCTALNDYFLNKRLLSISLTQTMSAASAIASPQFVKWTLQEFGFRGTLLLISGVSLQTFVAIALMQPVAIHMKKLKIPEGSTDEQESKFEIEELPQEGDDGGLKRMFKDLSDAKFLKSYLLSNASVGLTFCVVAEFAFILMLPLALYSMGWSEGNVALALSLTNIGDMVTRVLFIFLSKCLTKIGSHEIYIAGLVVAFVSRVGFLWSTDMTVVMVFITMMGIARCTICTIPPLVIADTVDPDKFATAMGIFMLLFGIISLIFGPVIGAVRDLTGSYKTAFYIPSACFAIVTVLWTIELCYKKHKKRVQKNN